MRKTTGFPLEPIGNNLFCARIDDYDGVVRGVAPSMREKQGLRAKVLAIGPDVTDVRPGDVILIGRATGVEMTLANQHVVGLRVSDVLAVLGGH